MNFDQLENIEKKIKTLNRIYHDIESLYYDEIHPEIINYERKIWTNLANKILSLIDFPILTCLDIGSGSGFVPSVLQQFIPRSKWVCSDLSIQMLKASRSRLNALIRANYVVADCENLPFINQTFDLITVNSVLHHIPNVNKFIVESNRLLKPKGVLVIAHEPNKSYYQNKLLFYLNIIISKFISAKYKLFFQSKKIRSVQNIYFRREIEAQVKKIYPELSFKDISRSVDVHSPTAGGIIDEKRGFEINEILKTGKWKKIEIGTYAHIGKLSFSNSYLIHFVEKSLAKCFPNHGYLFWLIAQKEI